MKFPHRKLGLAFANAGIFFLVAAFLPQKGSYGYSGVISKIINSRDRWDIPFLVLVGTIALSVAFLLLSSDEKKG